MYAAGSSSGGGGLGRRSNTIEVLSPPSSGTNMQLQPGRPIMDNARPELSRRPVSATAGAGASQAHDSESGRYLAASGAGMGSPSSSAISIGGGAAAQPRQHHHLTNHQAAARSIRAGQLEGRSYRFAPASQYNHGDLSSKHQHRQGQMTGAGTGAGNEANASGISTTSAGGGSLEAAYPSGGSSAFSPRSYTADEDFIRDRTAQLADMAIFSGSSASGDTDDDESTASPVKGSAGAKRGKASSSSSRGAPNRSMSPGRQSNPAGFDTIDAVLASATAAPPSAAAITPGGTPSGPSNLAIALQREKDAEEEGLRDPQAGGEESPDTLTDAKPIASPETFLPRTKRGSGIPPRNPASTGSNMLDRTDEEQREDPSSEDEYRPPPQLSSPPPSASMSTPQSTKRSSASTPFGRRASLAKNNYGYGALAQAQEEAQGHSSGVSLNAGHESMWPNPAELHLGGDAASKARKKSGMGSMLVASSMQDEVHETSPLLAGYQGNSGPSAALPNGEDRHAHKRFNFSKWKRTVQDARSNVTTRVRKLTWHDALSATAEPVRLLPAVILGLLMNVLDGVSYGMITFPTSYPIFSSFGGDGVSMFFMTCILSQLVFSLGGSIFGGGNGSMQIEVVPFYHILVKTIIDEVGEDNPGAIISTTLAAYALSSIFIGLTFLLLGWLRLGRLIEFFPRHILVGCIGGVGVFLIETGLEVSGRLEAEEGFQWNWETLDYFIQSWHLVSLWLPPLLLAVLLRMITHKFSHPLIFPAYFMVIPVVFYVVVFGILRTNFSNLRHQGWVFDIGDAADAPFYRYFTYIDFSQTSFRALMATIPTQLALTFFGILHVPLNIPALGISVAEDNVDTDRELIGHGISNLAAGLAFSGPNYITYVNSVLFYRVGGGSRLSGLMLAAGTFIILLAGPGMIGYLPVLLVGTLIFVLGIDLVKESLWDTIGRVNRWEYFTIVIIIIVMTLWDFVVGILAGIILACLFFVVQNSRRKTVRAIFDGSIARSTVRRHMTQRRFLDVVGTQTQILKLQGFLFFGTINGVEQLIRRALDIAAWNRHPMRFLLVDFSLVSGVDFSAAEAFTRIQRLLEAKGVVLVFCGVTPDSDVGIALRNVGMWADQGVRLEVFAHLNSALEWTENEYLRGMYASNLSAGKALGQASLAEQGALDVPGKKRQPAFVLDEAFENSPRRQHIHEAARKAITHISEHLPSAPLLPESKDSSPKTYFAEASKTSQPPVSSREQPLPLILATFRAYAGEEIDDPFFVALVGCFERISLPRGQLLWQQGDEPDGLYLIESGILKAKYDFVQENFDLSESMMAGTIAGELTFLSKQRRNTTAHAELDCVLWRLNDESLRRLQQEEPEVFGQFLKILLRVAGDEQEALMSYLVSRLT